MRILFITFRDFGDVTSGSGVRPFRLFEAFKALGHDVVLLQGLHNRVIERSRNIRRILQEIRLHPVDICYVEPPTGPFFCHLDLTLLKRVHESGVPVGLFYRDAYWMFPKWIKLPWPKNHLIRWMHRRDIRYFRKYCDIVYYPSDAFGKLFADVDFRREDVLPPGCEIMYEPPTELHHRLLYVGAADEADGLLLLLQSMQIVNETIPLSLTIVTAKKNHSKLLQMPIMQNGIQSGRVELVSGSGEDLLPYYRKSDFGVIPRRRHPYMDIAVPIKLFEYVGHGLGVIATNCPAMEEIIQKNQCGIVASDTAQDFSKAILNVYADPSKIIAIQRKLPVIGLSNSWETRAKKIVEDLSALRR